MAHRGPRPARPLATLTVLVVVVVLGLADLAWRWRFTGPERLLASWVTPADVGEPMTTVVEDGPGGRRRPVSLVPSVGDDPRLAPLRRAAASWRASLSSTRRVVDQVCLVPDVPSFFEAIAAWDDRHYFPILIDEPAWTLPFLRAFRPARVVRYAAAGPRSTENRPDRWTDALGAVGRARSPASLPDESVPPAGAPSRGAGPTAPGVVLSSPDSPMLAGAVALAAGHFQPLLRLEPGTSGGDPGGEAPVHYRDVLTLRRAWRFARQVEARVAADVPRYDGLGDDCDFLTIAGDWPYRYNGGEEGVARGAHCLDDLIGRVLEGDPDARRLDGLRRRWAFAGRLLGDPSASVYRAMAALFLAPEAALVWDTYAGDSVYAEYAAGPAAHILARAGLVRGPILLAAGPAASLANWHRVMDTSSRFGLIWFNSSGYPDQFSIAGGPGRPADVPGGLPSAVVMIHSHSAADPADPRTIGGRWLLQGAFAYFGSVNEPYLVAFRKPGLVADLAAWGIPLSAALREGAAEPFGRPWRLIFVGDPLYRIPPPRRAPGDRRREAEGGVPDFPRVDPSAWRRLAPDDSNWPVEEVRPPSWPDAGRGVASADRRLAQCRDASVAELARGASPPTRPGPDWRSVLTAIPRDRLDPRLRPAFDDLLIDALSQAGRWDELQARLATIPTAGRRPRVWAALETAVTSRLARAALDPDPARRRDRARAIREEVERLAWPPGSNFPAQLAARAATLERGERPAASGERGDTPASPRP